MNNNQDLLTPEELNEVKEIASSVPLGKIDEILINLNYELGVLVIKKIELPLLIKKYVYIIADNTKYSEAYAFYYWAIEEEKRVNKDYQFLNSIILLLKEYSEKLKK